MRRSQRPIQGPIGQQVLKSVLVRIDAHQYQRLKCEADRNGVTVTEIARERIYGHCGSGTCQEITATTLDGHRSIVSIRGATKLPTLGAGKHPSAERPGDAGDI